MSTSRLFETTSSKEALKNLANQLPLFLVLSTPWCSGAYWPKSHHSGAQASNRPRCASALVWQTHWKTTPDASEDLRGCSRKIAENWRLIMGYLTVLGFMNYPIRPATILACMCGTLTSCPYLFQLPQVFTTKKHIFGRTNDHFFRSLKNLFKIPLPNQSSSLSNPCFSRYHHYFHSTTRATSAHRRLVGSHRHVASQLCSAATKTTFTEVDTSVSPMTTRFWPKILDQRWKKKRA